MKTEFVREYKRRIRMILKSKLHNRSNKHMDCSNIKIWCCNFRMKTWKVRELDWKTQKLLIMHKELHPKSNVDRFYVSRKKGGRGLKSCESTIKSEENNLGW